LRRIDDIELPVRHRRSSATLDIPSETRTLAHPFGTAEQVARWSPLARDGADLPAALRAATPALARMGPGETADFTYVPTKPGTMMLEVWIERGQRIALPVELVP
jgi:hypothetical protein